MNLCMIILNYKDRYRAWDLAVQCSQYQSIQKIIIVDNHSDDGSYDWLKEKNNTKIEIIQSSQNNGFSAGNNVGLRYAITKYNPQYILLANTDTSFPETNIIECIKYLANDESLGLISTRMLGPDGKEQTSYYHFPTFTYYILDFFWLYRKLKRINNTKKQNHESSFQYVDIVRGSFMMLKSKAIVDIQYFDENTFLYCEETIISKRLEMQGYKVGILRDKYYLHNHIEKKNSYSIELQKILYESRLYYSTKYLSINKFQQFLMKVLSKYSLFELSVIYQLKQILGGKENEC